MWREENCTILTLTYLLKMLPPASSIAPRPRPTFLTPFLAPSKYILSATYFHHRHGHFEHLVLIFQLRSGVLGRLCLLNGALSLQKHVRFLVNCQVGGQPVLEI